MEPEILEARIDVRRLGMCVATRLTKLAEIKEAREAVQEAIAKAPEQNAKEFYKRMMELYAKMEAVYYEEMRELFREIKFRAPLIEFYQELLMGFVEEEVPMSLISIASSILPGEPTLQTGEEFLIAPYALMMNAKVFKDRKTNIVVVGTNQNGDILTYAMKSIVIELSNRRKRQENHETQPVERHESTQVKTNPIPLT